MAKLTQEQILEAIDGMTVRELSDIIVVGKPVGVIGEVHPEVLER